MAIRSIAQLKSWFKKGAYPTAEQFADWLDSFFHKEEKISINDVDQLSERLNDKYDRTDGDELRLQQSELAARFAEHDGNNDIEFAGIYESISSARTDISTIRDMLKSGVTLDEAKEALIELGENYQDVYAIASTLKDFLKATDTADDTINTWREIERFLDGITDADSLVLLLAQLEQKITERLSVTATTSANGLMSSSDKSKLDSVEANANRYVHPNDANTRHVTDEEKAAWNAKAEKGDKGDAGPQGEPGPQGPKGDPGEQGPQGLKGDTGATGPAGEKGDKGDPGATGPKGDTGDTGPKGDKGDTGPQGEPGPQGPKGDTGATGPTGAKGDKGDPGAVGPKGDTGATGPKGDKGDNLMNPAASTATTITLLPNDAISRDVATAVTLNISSATFTDGAGAVVIQAGAITPTITATGLTVQYVGAWKSVAPVAGKKVCYTFQRVGTDLIVVRNLCSTTPQ